MFFVRYISLLLSAYLPFIIPDKSFAFFGCVEWGSVMWYGLLTVCLCVCVCGCFLGWAFWKDKEVERRRSSGRKLMGRQVDQRRRNIQNSQEVHSLCFHSMTHMNPLRFPLLRILLEKLSVFQIVNNIALRNPDLHYRAHKIGHCSLHVIKYLKCLLPTLFLKCIILILFSHLRVGGFPLFFSYSDFPAKICVHHHLITLYIITLTQFGKEYKLRSPVRMQWMGCNKVVTPLIIFWLPLLGSIFQNIER